MFFLVEVISFTSFFPGAGAAQGQGVKEKNNECHEFEDLEFQMWSYKRHLHPSQPSG
jgi:hypothetical protein